MTISIDLTREAEVRLREQAAREGVPIEQLASRLLDAAASVPTPEEDLAAFQAAIDRTRMNDDEVMDFVDAETHRMRAEKRARRDG